MLDYYKDELTIVFTVRELKTLETTLIHEALKEPMLERLDRLNSSLNKVRSALAAFEKASQILGE